MRTRRFPLRRYKICPAEIITPDRLKTVGDLIYIAFSEIKYRAINIRLRQPGIEIYPPQILYKFGFLIWEDPYVQIFDKIFFVVTKYASHSIFLCIRTVS